MADLQDWFFGCPSQQLSTHCRRHPNHEWRAALMDFVYRVYCAMVLNPLGSLRRWLSSSGRLYSVMHAALFQRFLERIGEMRARAVFLKASRECPAYRDFLTAEQYRRGARWQLRDVP